MAFMGILIVDILIIAFLVLTIIAVGFQISAIIVATIGMFKKSKGCIISAVSLSAVALPQFLVIIFLVFFIGSYILIGLIGTA